MRGFLLALPLLAGLSSGEVPESCYSHIDAQCSAPGDDWTAGSCNSVHGGFKGNSDRLHRIIVDDFIDSMDFLLMATSFSTDRVNRMGFNKFFMEQSDKMWGRGKDMIKYILKRGGKMGSAFQIPLTRDTRTLGDYDTSNEMKALGVSLDIFKERANYVISAYSHSLSALNDGYSFDPTTAHKLEELSEDYSEDINGVAKKLNVLGKMVRNSNTNAMGLHLFDKSLL